jgi:CBS domain-containing protein
MTTSVLKKAYRPTVTIQPNATVHAAIQLMLEHHVGAVVVLEDGKAAGMFSERDVMTKVVLGKLDPETTRVSKVMTTPVVTVEETSDVAAALKLMIDRHIRHLPVVAKDGHVLGMLSMRRIMKDQIDILKRQVGALANYIAADGSGG